jgi:hypothetical protein
MSQQDGPGPLDLADLFDFDVPVWCWVVVAAGACVWLLARKIHGAEVAP